jgi:hypothetical protein
MRIALLVSAALLATASCAPATRSVAAADDDACPSQRVGSRAECDGDSSSADGMATYVVENGTSCHAQVTHGRNGQNTRVLGTVAPGGRSVFDAPARGQVFAIASGEGGRLCDGGARVRRVE